MTKRILSAAAIVVAMFGVTACSTGGGDTASAADTIMIGSVHPLSGGLAGVGGLMNDGAKLAIEDINAAGGIESLDGALLELIDGDSQGSAETGQSEAQRLISAGAVALVGTYQSDVTQNVASVAERAKVPLVIDVAVDDKILSQGYQYSFRIQPDASSMGQSGANELVAMAAASDLTINTVSYIHIEGAFGGSVFEAFKAEAEGLGITVAKEVTYSGTNFSDATTQVADALTVNPDVIVVTGYFPDNLLVAQAVKAMSPDIKAVYGIASGAFDDSSFPTSAGEAASGILSANYHYSATSDRAADIRTRFEAKYGKAMETSAMLSYQAVEVIAAGLEEGASADPVELRDAISGLSLEDPLLAFKGPIEFDERGQNKNASVIVMQVQDGVIQQVYPIDFATADLVFPTGQ
ncbi:ABC transporter substrate-binding protein [Cryobacterium sp. CG_9.6]|uniref:ABC transporter substrate-binding protein n=1 Tax=Cryobacterium sp. CG_9.6 TaxID=2760710 RepID=UPI002474BE26|nr:ABC transporter substrate-binding protein [Cryobacterium sp. CG_9.6]MDH6238108.1 branched-chain amino acid transport system substrate-binding protein [Cryobacterium sp. CG_9.6]